MFTDTCRVSAASYSLAGVVGGIVRTVSRAVAAEEASGVLGGNGGVIVGPPPLGFRSRLLQNMVGVLSCRWREQMKSELPKGKS